MFSGHFSYLAMNDFTPTFNVSWDAPAPVVEAPKPKLDAFGVDQAFASYQPNFSTQLPQVDLVQPKPVPPVDNLENTAAAKIFSDFCQNKFGFTPNFDQK